MRSEKKRRKDNDGGVKQVRSSYDVLKMKYAAMSLEMDELRTEMRNTQTRHNVEMVEMRTELCNSQTKNEEYAFYLHDIIDRDRISTACDSTTTTSYQSLKTQLSKFEENNKYLKGVVLKVREELKEVMRDNQQLKLGNVACRRVMQEYRDNITTLSACNDLQTTKVERYLQKERNDMVAREAKRESDRNIKKAVLRAFGWKQATADPIQVRAAIGFWNATMECTECGDSRASTKRRMDLWLHLTCEGFNGRLLPILTKRIMAERRFNVVELCRKSDVESLFNGRALQSVSECEPGKKKYARGLLCSDTTLRRMQKRVHTLAKSVGFSSLPKGEEGQVWCWGDEKGNFKTGVNRYVYEIYVKARSAGVTKDNPWKIALTGDLARVNFRGKAITLAGPKRVDPRLPCQGKTMKTSNQSRELYTPAVAGYVDEGYIMKYFDELVAEFRIIEAQGFCEVDGQKHLVHISVIVVADMAYLHKYLKRGGGSHVCTNFCFLCSVNKKYRAQGYPGGCLKCRLKDTVYNESTGFQQCRHHDVCDSIFLTWQNERLRYLKEVVKPRIPKSSMPFYENLEGLRAACLEFCSNDKERYFVMKRKSIAPLEKWLKVDGRTRGMLLLLPYILSLQIMNVM